MNTHGLDPRIAKQVNKIEEDDPTSGWQVNMRSTDGEWCSLYSISIGIRIEVYLKEDRVMAKAGCNLQGFSGEIAGMELGLPNPHLLQVVMQIETIKWFCPKDNINDHYHNVALEYMQAERKKRRAQRALEKE